MQNNLSKLFRIQRFLNDIKYPDAYRIAREISEYLNIKKRSNEVEIFKRLHLEEPWEYVRGSVIFCNNEFKISKDTLIPRIETEQLVYECKEYIEKNGIKNIVDVGTGSGSIVISLASLLKDNIPYSFYATDISKEALKIAKLNGKKILKTKKVRWLTTNLIKSVPKFDGPTLIIANLPYIPTEQYEKLEKSVLRYEPRLALDGGEDGLQYYKELFEQIKAKELNCKSIYIETESSIFKESKKLIKKYFPNSKVRGIKDCFNKERFLKIEL